MTERCSAPDADGRWCEFVGENGGPYVCVRCGREQPTSGSPRRDEAPKTGNPGVEETSCSLCGHPCYLGDTHPCCARQWNGRYCPSCEASRAFHRARPRRSTNTRRRRHTKKESQHG